MLARDIFGNPFRPVVADPAWRTPNILALAWAIYDGREFDKLPVLADMLEEIGCPTAVSDHLRGPGPHCRDCWALDSVLGRGELQGPNHPPPTASDSSAEMPKY